MAAEGPDELKSIDDGKGNRFQYSESHILGRGAGGIIYRATVVHVAPNMRNLAVGQEVALKNIKSSTNVSDREVELQKKEGTLYTTITHNQDNGSTKFFLVQPLFPGIDLRNALYSYQGPIGGEIPIGYKPISKEKSDDLLRCLENDSLSDDDKEFIATQIAGDVENKVMRHVFLGNIDISNIEQKRELLRAIIGRLSPKSMTNNERERILENFIRLQLFLEALMKDNSELLEIDKKEIRNHIEQNISLTNEQRDKIAYSIIRDYYAIQQLGIIHCDIKPDNILVDPQSGTAKIIDLGRAFLIQDKSHHPYEGAGLLYAVPSNHSEPMEKTTNSVQTDLYSIGIIIASMYSKNPYEVNCRNIRVNTDYRANLSDVLDNEIVEGMPDDLRQIVQHITQINPKDRPQNIALANGVNNSKELSQISVLQENSLIFAHTELAEHLDMLHDKFPIEINLFSKSQDLPDILRLLHLMKENSTSSTSRKLTQIIPLIEQYHDSHIRNLQQSRIDATG